MMQQAALVVPKHHAVESKSCLFCLSNWTSEVQLYIKCVCVVILVRWLFLILCKVKPRSGELKSTKHKTQNHKIYTMLMKCRDSSETGGNMAGS